MAGTDALFGDSCVNLKTSHCRVIPENKMVHFIIICVFICIYLCGTDIYLHIINISGMGYYVCIFYSLVCVFSCFLERAVPVQVFQKHETYLMRLPEDGPRHGLKHIAAIK
jgi:hypothetical protein